MTLIEPQFDGDVLCDVITYAPSNSKYSAEERLTLSDGNDDSMELDGPGAMLRLIQPDHPRSGDNVTIRCSYDIGSDVLYSIKWYWNQNEFMRYTPTDVPDFRMFPQSEITVSV